MTGIIRCQCLAPLEFKSDTVLVCNNEQCALKGVEISAKFWVTPVSDFKVCSRFVKFEKQD